VLHRIYYSERCRALKGLNGKDIYHYQFGHSIAAGDMIYVPDSTESCPLTFVQTIEDLPDEPIPDPNEGRDIKHPSTPANFRAIPTKNAVYLYWQPSTDNVAISHYIISTSLYHHVDERVREPGDLAVLPDERVTSDNTPSARLTDLQPDELYFFRIVAVDTSGNKSSYWSEEATAMTKSAIAEIDLRTTPLRMYQAQETENSFLLRWNKIVGAARFTVILEVDGERQYVNTQWFQNYIRIDKKLERKGKEMELIIRTLTPLGQRLEDSITFSF